MLSRSRQLFTVTLTDARDVVFSLFLCPTHLPASWELINHFSRTFGTWSNVLNCPVIKRQNQSRIIHFLLLFTYLSAGLAPHGVTAQQKTKLFHWTKDTNVMAFTCCFYVMQDSYCHKQMSWFTAKCELWWFQSEAAVTLTDDTVVIIENYDLLKNNKKQNWECKTSSACASFFIRLRSRLC